MQKTPVNALMETDIIFVSPEETLAEASRKMKDFYCGWLPVLSDGKPVGVITDRDIVIRAVAENLDPAAERVINYMTPTIQRCKSHESLASAVEEMRQHRVSRLLVVDKDDNMCGVLSFGRILRNSDDESELMSVVACIGAKSWYIPVNKDVEPKNILS